MKLESEFSKLASKSCMCTVDYEQESVLRLGTERYSVSKETVIIEVVKFGVMDESVEHYSD